MIQLSIGQHLLRELLISISRVKVKWEKKKSQAFESAKSGSTDELNVANLRWRFLGFTLKFHLLPWGNGSSRRAHLTYFSLLRTGKSTFSSHWFHIEKQEILLRLCPNLISFLVFCCLFDPHNLLFFLHGAPGSFHCFLCLWPVVLQTTYRH